MTLVTQTMIKQERLRSMARVFTQADQILTGQDVTVQVVDENSIPAPGYSNGVDISLNLPYIGSVSSTEDIIKINGLNFHELSHVMFTPRSMTWLIQKVKHHGVFDAFNMLEDQRIETFLTSMYKSTEPYFTKMIMDYLLGSERQWDSAYALLYGRKYLPPHVLEALRDRYIGQDHVDRLEEIIDDYRMCVFPRDFAEALDLIREYAALIASNGPQHQSEDPFGHSSGCRPEITEGDPMTDEEQDDAAAWTEYRDSERDEEEGEDGEGSGGDEESDEEGDDGSGSGSGSGDGDGDEEGEGDGEGESGEGTGGSGAGRKGSQAHKPKPETNKDLREAMKEAAKEAANDPEVQADAKQKESAINASSGKVPSLEQEDFALQDVSSGYLFASNGFKRELMKLWMDSDPGWHSHQSSGRINIDRVMQGSPLDESWDVWNEGKTDATSVEMVILTDISGSMQGSMTAASQALWAIKRAVENIGGEVTVLAFNDYGFSMYAKGEKAHRTQYRKFTAGGGTDPDDAMTAARMVLHYSKKKHKIVLFITDGSWSSQQKNNNAIKTLREHGILTALGFIGSLNPNDPNVGYYTHGVDVWEAVNNADGLVPLAKKIVKQAMTAN